MSSRMIRSSSSSFENEDVLFIHTIKRISLDYGQREISKEKIQFFQAKLFQIWMNTYASVIQRNHQGYQAIEYLESLLAKSKMNDTFFILIINVLSKNVQFYQLFLNNHQRFKQVFRSTSLKPVYLMRYLELLYYYCSTEIISNVGREFYHFVMAEISSLQYIQQRTYGIDWLAELSTFISQFSENTTNNRSTTDWIFLDQKHAIDYSIFVIELLLHHQFKSTHSKDFTYDLKLINTITKAIESVWQQNPPTKNTTPEIQDGITDTQLRSIEYLFNAMSTIQPPSKHPSTAFSPAILAFFSRIQLNAAELTLKSMFADGRLDGERLSRLTRYLMELLDSPMELIQQMPYETWITGLCTTLVTFNEHPSLLTIIDETTLFLIDHLLDVQRFDNTFQILFWFVRYDKRPQTFELLLKRLPTLFEQCRTMTNQEEWKTSMIELCHTALAIHPEYDLSKNSTLQELLRHLPQPDLNILLNHKTMHARYHSMISETESSIKNRVGIVNLGNTCYVNSVLQALYQCDLFRKYILEYYFKEQIVLRELQILFAQLNLSKRAHVNAVNLVRIARPAWFAINEQQDCAEFLGYLLDTIKDEEKKDTSLSSYEIERLFTIRTCQINRCQRCSVESYREESSNYLFLPIPTFENSLDNCNNNQSASPLLTMNNGLKFYPASNRNSASDEQARSLVSSPPPSNGTLEDKSFNLQHIFDCYFQKEELKDDNQYRCEHCQSLQNAERYVILQTAPEYLILSLNRFEFDKRTNIFRKVFTKISYPKVLNVQLYSPQHSRTDAISIKYCLVLIIVHTGYTLHGGHYYVYAREIKPSSSSSTSADDQTDYFSNDEWLLLNDDLVTSSSYEAMIDNCAQYSSATPYVLFYKRVDQQRINDIERTQQIHVRESLTKLIHENNIALEREQQSAS